VRCTLSGALQGLQKFIDSSCTFGAALVTEPGDTLAFDERAAPRAPKTTHRRPPSTICTLNFSVSASECVGVRRDEPTQLCE
jgi:hypothetical protein